MLSPKRTKFRKQFKGRISGNAKAGTSLNLAVVAFPSAFVSVMVFVAMLARRPVGAEPCHSW